MKALTIKLFTALLLAASLAGCAGMGAQDSAQMWMEQQPVFAD